MSMTQQWQIEEKKTAECILLWNILGQWYYHYHHIDAIIMISISSSSIPKTNPLTTTKPLWAMSITWVRPSPGCQSSFFEPSAFGSPLMSTISMGWYQAGFYLFKNFSPLDVDSMQWFVFKPNEYFQPFLGSLSTGLNHPWPSITKKVKPQENDIIQ